MVSWCPSPPGRILDDDLEAGDARGLLGRQLADRAQFLVLVEQAADVVVNAQRYSRTAASTRVTLSVRVRAPRPSSPLVS